MSQKKGGTNLTVNGLKCPNCGSERTGRSPTGVWCKDCGWCKPGLVCGVCGRHNVAERHHKTPKGKSCDATPDELRVPGSLEKRDPTAAPEDDDALSKNLRRASFRAHGVWWAWVRTDDGTEFRAEGAPLEDAGALLRRIRPVARGGWRYSCEACDVSGRPYTRETHLTPLEAAKAADCGCWVPDEVVSDFRPSSERSYILFLKAHGGPDAAEVGFPYDGGIEYRNFEPTPETQGLMEGLGALVHQRPLDFARILIDFEARRVEEARERLKGAEDG